MVRELCLITYHSHAGSLRVASNVPLAPVVCVETVHFITLSAYTAKSFLPFTFTLVMEASHPKSPCKE